MWKTLFTLPALIRLWLMSTQTDVIRISALAAQLLAAIWWSKTLWNRQRRRPKHLDGGLCCVCKRFSFTYTPCETDNPTSDERWNDFSATCENGLTREGILWSTSQSGEVKPEIHSGSNEMGPLTSTKVELFISEIKDLSTFLQPGIYNILSTVLQ